MKRFLPFVFTILLFGPGVSAGPSDAPAGFKLFDQNEKLATVRRLIGMRDFNGASAMLESLYEEDPGNTTVYNLLKQCYTELQYWPKLEALTNHFIEQSPDNPNYYTDLAQAIARQQGREDEAIEAYKEALSLVKGTAEPAANLIIQAMIKDAFEPAVLEYIDSIRTTDDSRPNAFGMMRGRVLENLRHYTDAADEYFRLLDVDSKVAVLAERRIYALLGFEESADTVAATLLNQAQMEGNARSFRILANFYIRKGDFDRAYDMALKQDSADGFKGHNLMIYMRACSESNAYAEMLRMGAYIRKNHADKPFVTDAYLYYCEALVGINRPKEAVVLLDSLYERTKVEGVRADILYRLGRIYSEQLGDYDTALAYMDSIAAKFNRGMIGIRARQEIGRIEIIRGRLSSARKVFAELAARNLSKDLAEAADYHIALIDFFDRQFDSSRAEYQRLMVDYPRGFYVNDALQTILVMDQAGEATELIDDYAGAVFYDFRRMIDSSVAELKLIADNENQAIADVALHRLAEIALARGDSTAAIEYSDKLIDGFPDSYYRAFGMKREADIYYERAETFDKARQMYRHLLEHYSDYPFISDVRKRMRQLDII